MDLIERQAAIDALVKESQVDGAYGYIDTKSIVDIIEDLPIAQPTQPNTLEALEVLDCISRQGAIDLLDNLIGMVDDNHGSDYDAALRMGIEALKAEEPNLQQTCNKLATDCISRQGAIDYIDRAISEWSEDKEIAMDCLRNLPSAQPEIKCDSCRYNDLEWDQEPCDSCTVVGENCHYKPSAQRKGKWMETDAAPHRIYCSECYATFIPNKEWVAWKENMIPRKYCPNCGADMREEE